MVKVKITPERIQEATRLSEFVNCASGNISSLLSILPRMIIDDSGEYIVKVNTDADGDLLGFENEEAAQKLLESIGTKRLFDFAKAISEGIKNSLINPPNGAV